MDPDKYQQAWQAQASQTRVTIDADLLLQEVQRNQREFRALILRRDFTEVAVGLLLLPLWFYAGITLSLPWTWYLGVPALIWMIGFIVVDRIRHKPAPSEPGEPLLASVRESLAQVEHQIWLLRNVFWWYLLPPGISCLAFFAQVTWRIFKDVNVLGFGGLAVFVSVLGFGGGLVVFVLALDYWIYWLNQRAVRTQLEPRREELLALLAGLGDGPTAERRAASSSQGAESPTTFGRWIVAAVACLVPLMVVALADGLFGSNYDQPPKSDGPGGAWLASEVAQLRKEKNLVALAAMVTVDGRVEAAAAQGERKSGSDVPIEVGDLWHLGGITKSITATMIARLVESGRMQWTDTVGRSFPDAPVHADWKSVTLRQLLTDTAGAPANFPSHVKRNRPAPGPQCTEERRKVVIEVIAEKPEHRPGTRFAYSNVGYTIAGAMAEKATGATWEYLVKQEVFEPLELAGAGFGPPKSPDDALPQPRGHRQILIGKIPVDDAADNTPIMGPSGNVHMSLRDLCTFASQHLRGELEQGQLISAETYKLLHTPALDGYAYGWLKKAPNFDIPHTLYWHNGSNTMWYALVVFIPGKNMVVAVTSNDGDFEAAESAAWQIVKTCANKLNTASDAANRRSLPFNTFPKKSPFAAVRWQDSQPEVQVGGEWFQLVSIDGIAASDIVAFSRRTYQGKWRMRFEEDLVELLFRMGHEPKDSVRLVVLPIGAAETRTLEDVEMTKANRDAIKAAAMGR